jgi:predicted acylesterase/phospholipase RssA
VSVGRVLRGKPVIDVNQILDLAAGLDAAGYESARGVVLSGMRSKRELWDVLLASSRMPWAGGAPIEIDGRRYLDGGMGSAIPVAEAVAAGATHVLALQTRPHGVPRRSASRIGDRLIERHMRQLNPALVTLYRDRVASYERVVDDIARRSLDPVAGPPHVLGIRPPAGTPCVSQLERRPGVLATAAAAAERLVEQALSPVAALRAA